MIKLTKLNGSEFVINAELIETAEATPDTVLKLTTDHTWVVQETVDEVIEKVMAYRHELQTGRPRVIGNN